MYIYIYIWGLQNEAYPLNSLNTTRSERNVELLGMNEQNTCKLVEHAFPILWLILISERNQSTKLVGGSATPLKNMSSSIGMISNPILMGK